MSKPKKGLCRFTDAVRPLSYIVLTDNSRAHLHLHLALSACICPMYRYRAFFIFFILIGWNTRAEGNRMSPNSCDNIRTTTSDSDGVVEPCSARYWLIDQLRELDQFRTDVSSLLCYGAVLPWLRCRLVTVLLCYVPIHFRFTKIYCSNARERLSTISH